LLPIINGQVNIGIQSDTLVHSGMLNTGDYYAVIDPPSPSASGVVTVDVTLNGTHIQNSPLTLYFVSEVDALPQSEISLTIFNLYDPNTAFVAVKNK
jgi:hypothetical protein